MNLMHWKLVKYLLKYAIKNSKMYTNISKTEIIANIFFYMSKYI